MNHTFIEIDCREMEPPEPMITVLASLPSLQQGQKIKMLHRIIPHPLFGKLQEKGFSYELEEKTKDSAMLDIQSSKNQPPTYTIWIWRKD